MKKSNELSSDFVDNAEKQKVPTHLTIRIKIPLRKESDKFDESKVFNIIKKANKKNKKRHRNSGIGNIKMPIPIKEEIEDKPFLLDDIHEMNDMKKSPSNCYLHRLENVETYSYFVNGLNSPGTNIQEDTKIDNTLFLDRHENNSKENISIAKRETSLARHETHNVDFCDSKRLINLCSPLDMCIQESDNREISPNISHSRCKSMSMVYSDSNDQYSTPEKRKCKTYLSEPPHCESISADSRNEASDHSITSHIGKLKKEHTLNVEDDYKKDRKRVKHKTKKNKVEIGDRKMNDLSIARYGTHNRDFCNSKLQINLSSPLDMSIQEAADDEEVSQNTSGNHDTSMSMVYSDSDHLHTTLKKRKHKTHLTELPHCESINTDSKKEASDYSITSLVGELKNGHSLNFEGDYKKDKVRVKHKSKKKKVEMGDREVNDLSIARHKTDNRDSCDSKAQIKLHSPSDMSIQETADNEEISQNVFDNHYKCMSMVYSDSNDQYPARKKRKCKTHLAELAHCESINADSKKQVSDYSITSLQDAGNQEISQNISDYRYKGTSTVYSDSDQYTIPKKRKRKTHLSELPDSESISVDKKEEASDHSITSLVGKSKKGHSLNFDENHKKDKEKQKHKSKKNKDEIGDGGDTLNVISPIEKIFLNGESLNKETSSEEFLKEKDYITSEKISSKLKPKIKDVHKKNKENAKDTDNVKDGLLNKKNPTSKKQNESKCFGSTDNITESNSLKKCAFDEKKPSEIKKPTDRLLESKNKVNSKKIKTDIKKVINETVNNSLPLECTLERESNSLEIARSIPVSENIKTKKKENINKVNQKDRIVCKKEQKPRVPKPKSNVVKIYESSEDEADNLDSVMNFVKDFVKKTSNFKMNDIRLKQAKNSSCSDKKSKTKSSNPNKILADSSDGFTSDDSLSDFTRQFDKDRYNKNKDQDDVSNRKDQRDGTSKEMKQSNLTNYITLSKKMKETVEPHKSKDKGTLIQIESGINEKHLNNFNSCNKEQIHSCSGGNISNNKKNVIETSNVKSKPNKTEENNCKFLQNKLKISNDIKLSSDDLVKKLNSVQEGRFFPNSSSSLQKNKQQACENAKKKIYRNEENNSSNKTDDEHKKRIKTIKSIEEYDLHESVHLEGNKIPIENHTKLEISLEQENSSSSIDTDDDHKKWIQTNKLIQEHKLKAETHLDDDKKTIEAITKEEVFERQESISSSESSVSNDAFEFGNGQLQNKQSPEKVKKLVKKTSKNGNRSSSEYESNECQSEPPPKELIEIDKLLEDTPSIAKQKIFKRQENTSSSESSESNDESESENGQLQNKQPPEKVKKLVKRRSKNGNRSTSEYDSDECQSEPPSKELIEIDKSHEDTHSTKVKKPFKKKSSKGLTKASATKEIIMNYFDKILQERYNYSTKGKSSVFVQSSGNSSDSSADMRGVSDYKTDKDSDSDNETNMKMQEIISRAEDELLNVEQENEVLARFKFDPDWDVHMCHTIETRISSCPTAAQRQLFEEFNIKIKVGPFTRIEDDIIKQNFRKFCMAYELQHNPVPFLNFRYGNTNLLSKTQRINFARHLGRGLENRMLFCIYNRFKTIYSSVHKGRFKEEEDAIILHYMKTMNGTGKNHYSTLSKILNRPRISIEKRYKMLRNRSEGINAAYYSKFVHCLMEVTHVEVYKELRDREITNEEWDSVSKILNIDVHKLKLCWTASLYTKLFHVGPIPVDAIMKKIVHMLDETKEDDYRRLNWATLAQPFKYVTRSFLYRLFKKTKEYAVPPEMHGNLRQCVIYLKDRYAKGDVIMDDIPNIVLDL